MWLVRRQNRRETKGEDKKSERKSELGGKNEHREKIKGYTETDRNRQIHETEESECEIRIS